MTVAVETLPQRRESRSAWLGRTLARKRAWIFAPFFVAALLLSLLRPQPLSRGVTLGGALALVALYAVRVWATGYRTWVHKSGAPRYLMSAGPYAYVRHPLYATNGLCGVAALVVLGRLELLAPYVAVVTLVTALVVLREEGALAGRFGAEHASYRASVPAFCPVPGRTLPHEKRRGRFSWEPVRSSFELWKFLGIAVAAAFFVARA
jgi:protein-S-isoprenylcysteine O-methyltransferase Ste14